MFSSYVLRRYATCAGVENCLTVCCSNVAVGIDIAVSIRNYVIMSIYCAIRRNFAACIQSNFTIVRGESSACSNIYRCIDIYFIVSSYVLRRYAASAGVKNCITVLCSNVAVSVDIACLSNKLNITIGCSNTLF